MLLRNLALGSCLGVRDSIPYKVRSSVFPLIQRLGKYPYLRSTLVSVRLWVRVEATPLPICVIYKYDTSAEQSSLTN